MATNKKPAPKAAKNVKASASASKKKAAPKPTASKGTKAPVKAAAKKVAPAKKAVPAKKAASVKKAAPAKKTAPVKKGVPAKKAAPVKAAVAAKNGKKVVATAKKATVPARSPLKNSKTVNKKTNKTEPVKAPTKKATAVPAKKAATPVKKVEPAKKAAPAPAKKAEVKKAAPVIAKKAAPAPAAKAAPAKAEPKKAAPAKSASASKAGAKSTATKTLPVRSAVPSPVARPAFTRSTVREEKKPNVIIAHRRLENKSKQTDDSGKTMINYQPDYTRSILDQPVDNQGPVYRYSDEELNEFRDLINGRLETARKELTYLQGLITRKDEAGTEDTENRYMNMEDGSGAMEREQLAQLASRQIQFINHLEKAMVRIENKTYGICRVTGKLIDKARLRAVPHATLSIEAKNTMTKK